jgi:hypothetical protein
MSESVRTYAGAGHAPVRRRRRFSLRGKAIFLFIVLLVVAYAWWATRDTCPIVRLIPADQTYQVFAGDVLRTRDVLAQSKLLHALPPESGFGDLSAMLSGGTGIPEWILNNLMPDLCAVSGKDLKTFGDALFVTRMTRVGCLLMKFSRLMPGVGPDLAGGLRLSRFSKGETSAYFAVRGRVLAVSPSRNALIRALTLRPEDAETPQKMVDALAGVSANDLHAILNLKPEDPLGGALDTLMIAARVEPASWRIRLSGVLRKEWRGQFDGFLEDLTPVELIAPPEGMLQISANFSKPLRDLWSIAAEFAGKRDEAESLWQKWSTPIPDAPLAPEQFATALLGQLGPGIRVSLCGIDLNEMLPVPRIVATFDADPEAVSALFSTLPPLAAGAGRYSMKPQYDAAINCIRWPLIGGPSMEPTAGIFGDALIISSSRTIAETLLNAGLKEQKLPQKGNLYVTLQPNACATAIIDLAVLLAENGLLKGYTPDRVQQTAAPWLATASAVKEITAIAACEKGQVTLDLAITQ